MPISKNPSSGLLAASLLAVALLAPPTILPKGRALAAAADLETGRDAAPRREDGDSLIAERGIDGFLLQENLRRLEGQMEDGPSLGGYYNFDYYGYSKGPAHSAFQMHHFTLLVTREREDWRVFGETEFEYGPVFEGDGLEVEEARGEVKLEQAWVSYHYRQWLSIRCGQMHLPGHANVRQWPNLWIGVRYPLMHQAVFPEILVGVQAIGDLGLGDWDAGYHAYVANGLSANMGKTDDNENKALGGKLFLHSPRLGWIRGIGLGLNLYRENPTGSERMRARGLEIQARLPRVELWAEIARRESGSRRDCSYIQPVLRLSRSARLYYRYDRLRDRQAPLHEIHTLGLNFNPAEDVFLKLEGFRSGLDGTIDSAGLGASLALAF